MGMPMSGAGLVSGSWEGSEEGASGDGEADGSGLKAGDSLTAGDSLAGGWLPVGEGYVTVVRRRVGYWVWLALAALAAFGVSYLFFTQGPQVLLDTLRDLPQTLSDSWYRLLHQWGLV